MQSDRFDSTNLGGPPLDVGPLNNPWEAEATPAPSRGSRFISLFSIRGPKKAPNAPPRGEGAFRIPGADAVRRQQGQGAGERQPSLMRRAMGAQKQYDVDQYNEAVRQGGTTNSRRWTKWEYRIPVPSFMRWAFTHDDDDDAETVIDRESMAPVTRTAERPTRPRDSRLPAFLRSPSQASRVTTPSFVQQSVADVGEMAYRQGGSPMRGPMPSPPSSPGRPSAIPSMSMLQPSWLRRSDGSPGYSARMTARLPSMLAPTWLRSAPEEDKLAAPGSGGAGGGGGGGRGQSGLCSTRVCFVAVALLVIGVLLTTLYVPKGVEIAFGTPLALESEVSLDTGFLEGALTFTAVNPNYYSVRIVEHVGSVFFQGEFVSTVELAAPGTELAKRSTSVVAFRVAPSVSEVDEEDLFDELESSCNINRVLRLTVVGTTTIRRLGSDEVIESEEEFDVDCDA